jgi:hypothetical protein
VKALFKKNDMSMAQYDKAEVLLVTQDKRYHSSELSETDEKSPEKC